jgi:nitroreductase
MTLIQERVHPNDAETRHPIHALLRQRWSPRAFTAHPIAPETLHRMLEAARWAPSAGNGQPWAFIIATRDDETEFARLLGVLNEKNQEWANSAAVLMLGLAATRRPDGKAHHHALYDPGLAVENLIVEGMANDVYAHQMAGFDADAARQAFAIPDGIAVVSAIALGYPADPALLPDDLRAREQSPRARKPLAEIAFRGRFGVPAPVVAD